MCKTNRRAHPVQSVFIDGVAEPHLAVQRMFLIVAHKIHQTLKLSRAAQHEEAAFLLDTTVFDLPLRPTHRQAREKQLNCKCGHHVNAGSFLV